MFGPLLHLPERFGFSWRAGGEGARLLFQASDRHPALGQSAVLRGAERAKLFAGALAGRQAVLFAEKTGNVVGQLSSAFGRRRHGQTRGGRAREFVGDEAEGMGGGLAGEPRLDITCEGLLAPETRVSLGHMRHHDV